MNRTVIVNSNRFDKSTVDVLRWINYLGGKFIRINENNDILLDSLYIGKDRSQFKYKTNINSELRDITSDEIHSFWYRRGYLNFSIDFVKREESVFFDQMNQYLQREIKTLQDFINYKHVNSIKSIGNVNNNTINKLILLELAKCVGFEIPETIVTTSKERLMNFVDTMKHNRKTMISKSINTTIGLISKKNTYGFFTSVLTEKVINSMEQNFFPTLFQEQIEKICDIRVFYLNGKCFSAAIFSQNDDQTRVDFRKYNYKKPNRVTPFLLPRNISNKIVKLMRNARLNSGSLDILYTQQMKFVFLEVNPIGQFWQISHPCNYFLEKQIAQFLIYQDETPPQT